MRTEDTLRKPASSTTSQAHLFDRTQTLTRYSYISSKNIYVASFFFSFFLFLIDCRWILHNNANRRHLRKPASSTTSQAHLFDRTQTLTRYSYISSKNIYVASWVFFVFFLIDCRWILHNNANRRHPQEASIQHHKPSPPV